MIETWTNIPGYSGKYQVDREGNVRRVFPSGKTRPMSPYHKKMQGSQRMVVKLTIDGKSKEEILMQIVAKAFLGECPKGCVPYHINGCQTENHVNNIAYIPRSELGKKTGAKAKRKSVAKIDKEGRVVEFYSSAREAARENFMSYQTVIDRCNGKCKSAFAPDGYAYAWEDSKASMRQAMNKVNKEVRKCQKRLDG